MSFVSDPFTDTSGTAITAHTASTTWTAHPNNLGSAAVSNANRVRSNSGAGIGLYYAAGTPANGDYDVEADFYFATVQAGDLTGLAGRLDTSANTGYVLRYDVTNTRWQLAKLVAGTLTSLGTLTATPSAASTVHAKLEMRGTTINAYINGTSSPDITVTDSSITTAGKAGLRFYTVTPSDSAGTHIDNFTATDAPAVTGLLRTIANMAGTQSVPHNTAAVKATWDTEREDTLGSFTGTSGSPSGNFTIPSAGLYMITVCPAWATQNSTGVRAYHLQVDPLGVSANAVMLCAHHDAPSTYNGCYPFSWTGTLAATDVISVWCYQESGAALNWGGTNRPLVSAGQSRNCEISIVRLSA